MNPNITARVLNSVPPNQIASAPATTNPKMPSFVSESPPGSFSVLTLNTVLFGYFGSFAPQNVALVTARSRRLTGRVFPAAAPRASAAADNPARLGVDAEDALGAIARWHRAADAPVARARSAFGSGGADPRPAIVNAAIVSVGRSARGEVGRRPRHAGAGNYRKKRDKTKRGQPFARGEIAGSTRRRRFKKVSCGSFVRRRSSLFSCISHSARHFPPSAARPFVRSRVDIRG